MKLTTNALLTMPQAGEIWLPLTPGDAVVVTGVISEEGIEYVYFSKLNSVAHSAELSDFSAHYIKRS